MISEHNQQNIQVARAGLEASFSYKKIFICQKGGSPFTTCAVCFSCARTLPVVSIFSRIFRVDELFIDKRAPVELMICDVKLSETARFLTEKLLLKKRCLSVTSEDDGLMQLVQRFATFSSA